MLRAGKANSAQVESPDLRYAAPRWPREERVPSITETLVAYRTYRTSAQHRLRRPGDSIFIHDSSRSPHADRTARTHHLPVTLIDRA